AETAGMSRNTVIDGTKAFDVGETPTGRVRAEGGGRPVTEEVDPTLLGDLEGLVEPGTRGDPMSPLRWTLRSTRQLARALQDMGHTVSHSLVGILLHELGFSLQATAKVTEGNQHPDRGGQFDHINAVAAARLVAGEPVISVDCKKKVRHEVARGERARRSEVRPMPAA
ncbi:MAG: ISAzo13-like element transposase-related protein, partial [Gemmatimonadales bacterium]